MIDISVAVVGVTGVGRRTFVSYCAAEEVCDSLKSCLSLVPPTKKDVCENPCLYRGVVGSVRGIYPL